MQSYRYILGMAEQSFYWCDNALRRNPMVRWEVLPIITNNAEVESKSFNPGGIRDGLSP